MPGPVYPDADGLARAAADLFIEVAARAIRERGVFTVALAGGSTPKRMHQLLAGQARDVNWPAVEVFFGDERCVPPDHPDSNYRAARESLLAHVPVPSSRVHRMPGELEPGEGSLRYESVIQERLGPAVSLDLIWLGMGADGHTLSLFPGHDFDEDRDRWCVPSVAPSGSPVRDRITLTLSAVARARRAVFVVSGADKAAALARVRAAPPGGDPQVPASLVRCAGEVTWLTDRAAAG